MNWAQLIKKKKSEAPVERYSVGIEIDEGLVRAVRLSTIEADTDHPLHVVTGHAERMGDFSAKDDLVHALGEVMSRIGRETGDRIAACFAGRKMHAAELEISAIESGDVEPAIKEALRKFVTFDIESAPLKWRFLGDESRPDGSRAVCAALCARGLFDHHMHALDKAGLRADILTILPLVLTDTFMDMHDTLENRDAVYCIIYTGPAASRIVMAGVDAPFFYRSAYPALDTAGGATDVGREESCTENLVRDVRATLSFYQKAHPERRLAGIIVSGRAVHDALTHELGTATGLEVRMLDTSALVRTYPFERPGVFDAALTLARNVSAHVVYSPPPLSQRLERVTTRFRISTLKKHAHRDRTQMGQEGA